MPGIYTADGEMNVDPDIESSIATRTSVVSAATDTLFLSSKPTRRGFTVYNESTATLYLALGTGAASLTSYTVQIPASSYYEGPFDFTGEVRGIWSAANGNARVTEFV